MDMVSSELINYINNELPIKGEWWCDDSKEKFHWACGVMLAHGVSVTTIKEVLTDLYLAVVDEYGA